jgi:hypothetical protein
LAGKPLNAIRGADVIRPVLEFTPLIDRYCAVLRCALRHRERLASTSDIGSAVFAIGEQAVVTDAMEALGQHMDQDAPDELISYKLRLAQTRD